MQLALTGATGFVGRHVIRLAVRRGYEVIALTRNPAQTVHDCIGTRAFSAAAPPDLSGCDAVLHLAGENVAGLWTRGKMQRIRDSRILGTRRIAEAICASSHPPDVFVSASAIGFYGDSGEAELTEESPHGAGFLADTCREWEHEAMLAESHCRTVRTRIGLVLGRGGGALRMMLPFFRIGLGARIGSGRQWMSWIHAEDLASLLLFAVENLDVRGALNATAPWPVRNADFTRTLARSVRRPAFFAVPGFALRLLLGEFSRELLDSKRVLPAAATGHGFGFRFPELAPALADITA
ncbi:MAG: TIGR01777 family oxidoreductase [Chthoniobacteraceae bacterium]